MQANARWCFSELNRCRIKLFQTYMSTVSVCLHATVFKECVFLYVFVRVSVDRRAAAYTDGQMSVAGEQQMPEVTPPAAFHWTTGFNTKPGAAPNITYTCLCLTAKGHLFPPVIHFHKTHLTKKSFVTSVGSTFFETTCWTRIWREKRMMVVTLGSCYLSRDR